MAVCNCCRQFKRAVVSEYPQKWTKYIKMENKKESG